MARSLPHVLQVAYCEEAVQCRRVMMLSHFSEKFSAASCQRTCDNCQNNAGQTPAFEDWSEAARKGEAARLGR